jgi:hypothetical protein
MAQRKHGFFNDPRAHHWQSASATRSSGCRPSSRSQPMDAIVTEAGIRWHRRHVPGAKRPAVASAEDDPNVEPVECSSPPCFMHEL